VPAEPAATPSAAFGWLVPPSDAGWDEGALGGWACATAAALADVPSSARTVGATASAAIATSQARSPILSFLAVRAVPS
jgi:hypothetical protein